MICTYMRSSSLGTWKICPFSYFLQYNLGIKTPSGHAADKGSITHKSLELLARFKLAQQRGQSTFSDTELGLTFESITPDEALELSYKFYSEKNPQHPWAKKDKEDCRKWMFDAMTFNGGLFSPLLREVIEPEQYFDLVIEEDWAKYEYELPNGEVLTGNLAIKGTMDLLCGTDDPDVYELIDWKTGRRVDWSDGSRKEYADLREDVQLRLYHYALTRIYPNKTFFVSIAFLKDGGVFSLPPMDTSETLEILKGYFEEIRSCNNPLRVIGTPREWIKGTWRRTSKCKSFCHFGKTLSQDGKQSLCDFYHGELQKKGIEKVLLEYGDLDSISKYGSGGGVTDRET